MFLPGATSPPPLDMRVVRPNPLTTPDQLRFLATMKRELADEIQKYDEFVNVLAEFRNGRSVTGTILAD